MTPLSSQAAHLVLFTESQKQLLIIFPLETQKWLNDLSRHGAGLEVDLVKCFRLVFTVNCRWIPPTRKLNLHLQLHCRLCSV